MNSLSKIESHQTHLKKKNFHGSVAHITVNKNVLDASLNKQILF